MGFRKGFSGDVVDFTLKPSGSVGSGQAAAVWGVSRGPCGCGVGGCGRQKMFLCRESGSGPDLGTAGNAAWLRWRAEEKMCQGTNWGQAVVTLLKPFEGFGTSREQEDPGCDISRCKFVKDVSGSRAADGWGPRVKAE